MQEYIWVTGIILKQSPIGEYDRRISLLTKERGKLSAFAKGARRSGSRLAAATAPFVFGKFKLYEGRSSYTLAEADVQNYFEELREDYIGACYGMYFAEVADYYTRENNDEKEMLKLLYQSLKALCAPSLPDPLVRCVYELRAIAVNGEFPGPPTDRALEESTLYSLQYIVYLCGQGLGAGTAAADRGRIYETVRWQGVQKSGSSANSLLKNSRVFDTMVWHGLRYGLCGNA